MKLLQKLLPLILMILLLVCPHFVHAQDEPETRILMPTIEVDTSIVPLKIRSGTWDVRRLTKKVGFFTGTAWFGENGNIGLGGHSEKRRGVPDVFYHLDQILVDDPITVYIGETELQYRVVSVELVAYNDLTVLLPTDFEQLTIITCDLNSYKTNGDYARRVVVKAIRA